MTRRSGPKRAVALRYWFGIGVKAVWRRRKAFGVEATPLPPAAERRSVRRQRRVQRVRVKDWKDEELDRMADAAKRRGTRLPPRWTPATGAWTAVQDKLLGADDDEVIATKVGKTVSTVTGKRVRLKVPVLRDRRCGGADSPPAQVTIATGRQRTLTAAT